MKITKITAALLLGATVLTGTVACSKSSDSSTPTTSQKSTVSSSKETSTKESSSSTHSEPKQTAQIKVTQQEAIDKFNNQFKDKQIKSIDLSLEGKQYVYEIEGFDSNNDYSVDINAETDAVSHVHSEKLDRDDRNQKALDLSGVISRDEANRIAQEHAKGTSEEWKLERDDTSGKTYWEVKVKNGHQETEIKIDAHSKAVVSTEHDD